MAIHGLPLDCTWSAGFSPLSIPDDLPASHGESSLLRVPTPV